MLFLNPTIAFYKIQITRVKGKKIETKKLHSVILTKAIYILGNKKFYFYFRLATWILFYTLSLFSYFIRVDNELLHHPITDFLGLGLQ